MGDFKLPLSSWYILTDYEKARQYLHSVYFSVCDKTYLLHMFVYLWVARSSYIAKGPQCCGRIEIIQFQSLEKEIKPLYLTLILGLSNRFRRKGANTKLFIIHMYFMALSQQTFECLLIDIGLSFLLWHYFQPHRAYSHNYLI